MKTSEIVRNEALKHETIAAKLNRIADELELIEGEGIRGRAECSADGFDTSGLAVTPCNANDLAGVSQTEACRRVLGTFPGPVSKEEIYAAIIARGGSIKGPAHLGPVLSRNKELFARVGKDQWCLTTAIKNQ